jgi:adenine-specific DNA-methyltransferase
MIERMNMDKLKMHSPDLSQDNIAKIRELFPNCVTEARDEKTGKLRLAIDFDQLRQELTDHIVEGPQERYRLDWPGKREALALANAPIAKALRPCPEESLDFDTTKNLFIEGDNLEVLKLIQDTYLGQIKLIYIDPPYNTGKDFIYRDSFASDQVTQEIASGERSEEGARLVANPEGSGRFHSNWLSMMYCRLKIARNLLKDDGVIAIHIDENEYPNLEKLLSEVFGEKNNLGTIVWDKRNPKGEVVGVAQQHEIISVYCKSKEYFKENCDLKRPKENASRIIEHAIKLLGSSARVTDEIRRKFREWISKQDFSGGEKAYCFIDDNGDVYRPVSMAAPDKPETRSHRPLIHPHTGKPCPVPAKGWRFPDKSMDELVARGEVLFGEDETTQPNRKYLLKENMFENVPSLLYYGGSDDGLFTEMDITFDNPKPLAIAKKIIQPICTNSDLVLDFFAGASTAAHAVMQLNAEDGKRRQFIMVQLPEECPPASRAAKAGLKTIADLSKERIRRAGKKILEGECHPDWNRDVGFRVLKVDTSNMKDVYYRPDDLKQSELPGLIDNVKPDRTAEDLLFQVLVDWGVDLTLPIRRETVQGKTVFFVDDNALVACFDKGITEDLVKELAGHEPLRVVFRDNGFVSDAVKINVEQIFRQLSPITEVKSI